MRWGGLSTRRNLEGGRGSSAWRRAGVHGAVDRAPGPGMRGTLRWGYAALMAGPGGPRGPGQVRGAGSGDGWVNPAPGPVQGCARSFAGPRGSPGRCWGLSGPDMLAGPGAGPLRGCPGST